MYVKWMQVIEKSTKCRRSTRVLWKQWIEVTRIEFRLILYIAQSNEEKGNVYKIWMGKHKYN
jgi:hypothetical protein